MKQVGGLFSAICDRKTLALAAYRAARGKHDRPEVRSFFIKLEDNLAAICRELSSGAYRFGTYRHFPVRDTKSRIIHAPPFRDRVVHHAVIALAGPVFERGAICHSYACRQGKGQHRALHQARRWTRFGDWYGKMDVRKFYDSVDHALLRGFLRRRFREKRLLCLFDGLLDSYATTAGRGLPIGALTSQYLGNFYLDRFDHLLKATGLARRYIRYMDDIVVWGDQGTLTDVRGMAIEALSSLNLELKHGGEWNRCSEGIPFLGFIVYPNRIRLGKQGRRRLRRRWHAVEREYEAGGITEADLQCRSEALFAHALHADDIAWRRAVIGFSRFGDGPKPRPGHPGRQLEHDSAQLPLSVSQQEGAHYPQQESGLPGLSGFRHGGAPPDDARSRALELRVETENSRQAPISARGKRCLPGEPSDPNNP